MIVTIDMTLLPTIIEVGAIAGGLVIYLGDRRISNKVRKVRYARMLLAELKILRKKTALYNDTDMDSIDNSTELLPRNAYDGLVSSSNIAYLDHPLQMQIHQFYELVFVHNHNLPGTNFSQGGFLGPQDEDGEPRWIKPELRCLIFSIEEFIHKNQLRPRWKWVLKMLWRTYGD